MATAGGVGSSALAQADTRPEIQSGASTVEIPLGSALQISVRYKIENRASLLYAPSCGLARCMTSS
jgi:hypothetical protein